MRTSFWKIAGPVAAVVFLASVCLVGLKAQQATNKRGAASLSTNWVGCLVVGKQDTLDRIARGPYPATVGQVEIGLRSDGVVVWRSGLSVKVTR